MYHHARLIILLAAVPTLHPAAGEPDAESEYGVHSRGLRESTLRMNPLVAWSRKPVLPLDHEGQEYQRTLIDPVD